MSAKQSNNRSSKNNRGGRSDKWWPSLRDETRHSILAIVSMVLGIFFVLASISKAGLIGDSAYRILRFLFGAGYFLVPTVLFFSTISFVTPLRAHLIRSTVVGGVLFLISSLGVLSIIVTERTGGYVGFIATLPFIKFFDFWVSLIFFTAVFVISILIMFNAALSIGLRPKKEGGESEVKVGAEDASISLASIAEKATGVIQDIVPKTQNNKDNLEGEFTLSPSPIKRVGFIPPPISLLEEDRGKPSSGDIKANSNIIKRTLQNFGIEVEMAEVSIGPSITQYALKPAEGVKLSRILGLQNDLSLALAAHPIRIEAPIPGRSLVGIEVPNSAKTIIGLASLLKTETFQKTSDQLLLALGKDVTGQPVFANVKKMPHLLIAGATGAGKSVAIHALIVSLLYHNSPESLRFIMIDPKRVELSVYNKIPHMLTPVITNAKQAILTLKWAGGEMERRYDLLLKVGARDIEAYHGVHDGYESMPYLVIIIDELADLMVSYPREMEASIVRLAQMSRATGIHLILSTQRPSVEVITGLIKANITTRIALQVASQIDSRTIIDMSGAEKLLGKGDMLYLPSDSAKPKRVQGPYISEKEIKKVVDFLAKEYKDVDLEDVGPPGDLPAVEGGISGAKWQSKLDMKSLEEEESGNEDDDELYEAVREEVLKSKRASTSFVQRKFKLGYARAARIMDLLEERGVVGPGQGAKPREMLLDVSEGGSNFEKITELGEEERKL